MYSGSLQTPFPPEGNPYRFAEERRQYMDQLRHSASQPIPRPVPSPFEKEKGAKTDAPEPHEHNEKHEERERLEKESALKQGRLLTELFSGISVEDSALIGLIFFLLLDNSEKDILLIGVLLYILLAR